MSEDCLICHESVINKTFEDDPSVTIYQTCDCIYNVHKYCLIKWSRHHSRCIICHKNIHVYREGKSAAPKENIFTLCCTIL